MTPPPSAGSGQAKATLILIHLDDGSRLEAHGEQAANIWQWWNSVEIIAATHGIQFKGEPLRKLKAPQPPESCCE